MERDKSAPLSNKSELLGIIDPNSVNLETDFFYADSTHICHSSGIQTPLQTIMIFSYLGGLGSGADLGVRLCDCLAEYSESSALSRFRFPLRSEPVRGVLLSDLSCGLLCDVSSLA